MQGLPPLNANKSKHGEDLRCSLSNDSSSYKRSINTSMFDHILYLCTKMKV